MMPIWIGSPTDIREGTSAEEALRGINDTKYLTKDGVLVVDRERWEQAQRFELATWMTHATYAESDRNHEHKAGFDDYKALPASLGAVLEVGCGPFTQLGTILDSGKTASNVALLDPLAESYLLHPHCAYKGRQFRGLPTNILSMPAEDLLLQHEQDTIVCINVLEHVIDARVVLDKILTNLKPGGIVVFHERPWDNFDPYILYDVGHPIRCSSQVLAAWKNQFNPLFDRGDYFIGQRPL